MRSTSLSYWHVVPPCPALSKRRAGWVTLRERFSAWLTYSRLALAIINLVAEPQAPGRRSDLNRLDYFFGRRVTGPATAVNFWLSVCRIDLRLHGKPPRAKPYFPIPVGLAQLGIQLALVGYRAPRHRAVRRMRAPFRRETSASAGPKAILPEPGLRK